MIITQKIPATIQVPVVTGEGEVEIYYAKPQSLGKVVQLGQAWFTVDGVRHTSARAAMRYLVIAHEQGRVLVPGEIKAPVPRPARRRSREIQAVPQEILDLGLDLNDPIIVAILRLLRNREDRTPH